jgi:hypothetical protein
LLKRVEPWGFTYSLESEPAFTWAEPGDPPLTQLALEHLGVRELLRAAGPPIALHLRAPRCPEALKKPPRNWPTGLKSWQERELLRRWRGESFEQEDGARVWTSLPNENALTALVEAHRPMVASMALGRVGTKRKTIIEYGMFGLRFAAQQWASRKKKGARAGFDPAKGFRFSTYARAHAKRFMIDAAQAMKGIATIRGRRCVIKADNHGYFGEPPFEDTITKFRKWAATPIPDEIERERNKPLPDPGEGDYFPELGFPHIPLGGANRHRRRA